MLKIIRRIGSGSFAVIYEAEVDGKLVAMKDYTCHSLIDKDERLILAETEVAILKRFDHVNVQRVIKDMKSTRFCMPLAECDVSHLVVKHPSFINIRQLMCHLIHGLHHIHQKGIMHKDIKPWNVLWSKGQYIITDFGSARPFILTSYLNEMMTTPGFRAPEILKKKPMYHRNTDVWAVAMTVLFGLNHGCYINYQLGGELISERVEMKLIQKYIRTKTLKKKFIRQLGPSGFDLLMKMLEFDPSRRISASEATKHPYVSTPVFFGKPGECVC